MEQAGQVIEEPAAQFGDLVVAEYLQQRVQRLDPGAERHTGGHRVCAGPQHRPLVMTSHQFRRQPGLADARFPGERHAAELAGHRTRVLLLQPGEFLGPPYQLGPARCGAASPSRHSATGGRSGRAVTGPDQFDRRQRIGQPLELQRPEGAEPDPAPAAHQARHQLTGQDLPAARCRAEPGGHHHRGTEVVAVLPHRFAGLQSDAHRQRHGGLRRIVCGHRVLDRDRCLGRIDRGGEDHHQPVAEVLHLLAGVRADGGAEQTDMHLAECLASFLAQSGADRGGVDQVGEQEGDHTAADARSGLAHLSPPQPR